MPSATTNRSLEVDARCPSTNALHDDVASRCFTEPLRAQLGRPALRLEIDGDEPEAVAESVVPLEVVQEAPVEVALDGHALVRGALELGQIAAHVHDAVRVVDPAVGGRLVLGRAAVLRDEDLLRFPQ